MAELDRLVAAFRDPTRRAILLRFQCDPAPRTVDEVASAAGVHRSVAFTHLEQLAALGFLTVGRRKGRQGKPAKLYQLDDRLIQFSHPARDFLRLSTLLAEALAEAGESPADAVRRIGRREGARIAAPGTIGIDAAVEVLDRLGGLPLLDGEDLHAQNCIFREACAAAPELVCGLQAALLEGAAEPGGRLLSVAALGSDGDGGCHFRVAHREPAGEPAILGTS